ncbi:MAG: hypothetical protein FWC30_01880 [Candidatus Bathyarchaeota archaeon]|nr:hypothetical protein [Candidatus Termiticorpusculum sp.]
MNKYVMVKGVESFVVVLVIVLLLPIFLVSAVESGGYWISKAAKPTVDPFGGGCVVASNGIIYTISGDGTNEMYDPITDT